MALNEEQAPGQEQRQEQEQGQEQGQDIGEGTDGWDFPGGRYVIT
ncbi:hypothetical protein AB0Q95_42915 [Streptomyces sp. NPDC059900]